MSTATTLPLDESAPKTASRTQGTGRETYPRFTIDGDAALESHLAITCDRIAAGLRGLLPPQKLEAVLLGGGYGRGEGGVLRTMEGDRPYNDLEFYVCLRGSRHVNERLHGRALQVFGEILTPQAGVDVEFHITSLREIAAAEVSMFSYDLIRGHRWLIGEEHHLDRCVHHRDADCIPPTEATRLLMNRCSGLLFAADRLARPVFTPDDADFVARNIAKAQLGAGDAALTAYHQYHWSVRERQQRLARLARTGNLPCLHDLVRHHGEGAAFKLHPTRSTATRNDLAGPHQHLSDLCRETWLWLESRRLGASFRSIRDYIAYDRPLWPDAPRIRVPLVNAKVFGITAAFKRGAFRHPRERVLRALPSLLWQRDALASPANIAWLQRELQTPARDFAGFVAAYRNLWSRVN